MVQLTLVAKSDCVPQWSLHKIFGKTFSLGSSIRKLLRYRKLGLGFLLVDIAEAWHLHFFHVSFSVVSDSEDEKLSIDWIKAFYDFSQHSIQFRRRATHLTTWSLEFMCED